MSQDWSRRDFKSHEPEPAEKEQAPQQWPGSHCFCSYSTSIAGGGCETAFQKFSKTRNSDEIIFN